MGLVTPARSVAASICAPWRPDSTLVCLAASRITSRRCPAGSRLSFLALVMDRVYTTPGQSRCRGTVPEAFFILPPLPARPYNKRRFKDGRQA